MTTAQPADLVLDLLRAMRGDMSRMADDVHGLRMEMVSFRQHLSGVVTLQDHEHGDLAAVKARLDRIEKRFEIVE